MERLLAYSLVKRNTITIEEYASALLSRIESRDNVVKAWEYLGTFLPSHKATDGRLSNKYVLDKGSVLSEARSLDQVPHAQRGPLHGAVIAIKDMMDTKRTVLPCHCTLITCTVANAIKICPQHTALHFIKDIDRAVMRQPWRFYGKLEL